MYIYRMLTMSYPVLKLISVVLLAPVYYAKTVRKQSLIFLKNRMTSPLLMFKVSVISVLRSALHQRIVFVQETVLVLLHQSLEYPTSGSE